MKLQKLSLLFLALSATAFAADTWSNRPEVLRSAEMLATEVEHFDEALHNINAPTHVLQKVHHFEETVIEFVDDVKKGSTFQYAQSEFQHIRQDVAAIRAELNAHPHLLHNNKVYVEWQALRRAYRYLDHAMLNPTHHRTHSDRLESDIRALEEHAADTN